jgi:YfiH family protein
MPFHHTNSIKYFTFDSLSEHGVKHAVFTRLGGVSPEPWNTLNVGGTVGDDIERVRMNRKMSFKALDLNEERAYEVWQVHGSVVAIADSPRESTLPFIKSDAILSAAVDVPLFMRFADCVPIFLYDPKHDVIGLVHSGWLGTVRKVVAEVIDTMVELYGTSPNNVIAAIGPSIGPDHYTIGKDVESQIVKSFGENSDLILNKTGGNETKTVKTNLDLWRANEMLLQQKGVANIEISGICTACNLKDWFSHRAEGGKTGRFGAVIVL